MDGGEGRLCDALPAWSRHARIEERLGGGHRGAVWSVRIDGARYAARVSDRSQPALAWELALLMALDRAGLWVPTPLPAPDGRLQVNEVVMLTWLDGEAPRTAHDWRLVGWTLRRIHALTRNRPQRPGFRSARDLLWEDAGGDVRLDRLPPEVVAEVRAAWQPLADEPLSVVHGDPNRNNIRIAGGRVGLLDWDEARVDSPLFDLAALPLERLDGVEPERLRAARRAATAWEVANGWLIEPEYARRRLRELIPNPRR